MSARPSANASPRGLPGRVRRWGRSLRSRPRGFRHYPRALRYGGELLRQMGILATGQRARADVSWSLPGRTGGAGWNLPFVARGALAVPPVRVPERHFALLRALQSFPFLYGFVLCGKGRVRPLVAEIGGDGRIPRRDRRPNRRARRYYTQRSTWSASRMLAATGDAPVPVTFLSVVAAELGCLHPVVSSDFTTFFRRHLRELRVRVLQPDGPACCSLGQGLTISIVRNQLWRCTSATTYRGGSCRRRSSYRPIDGGQTSWRSTVVKPRVGADVPNPPPSPDRMTRARLLPPGRASSAGLGRDRCPWSARALRATGP